MCVFNNKGCCISSFSRVYDEEQCRQELKVLVLDNDSLAEVEFRSCTNAISVKLSKEEWTDDCKNSNSDAYKVLASKVEKSV